MVLYSTVRGQDIDRVIVVLYSTVCNLVIVVLYSTVRGQDIDRFMVVVYSTVRGRERHQQGYGGVALYCP